MPVTAFYSSLIRQVCYLLEVLVEVVLLIVSDEPFLCFRFFLLDLVVVLVLPVEVFWANTAPTGSSERPRVAIMIFFIFGNISLFTCVIALSAFMSIISNRG